MSTKRRDSFHLDLRIGHDAEGYFARVERSPQGEGEVRIHLESFEPWLDRLDPTADPCRNLVPSLSPALRPTLREEAEHVGRELGRAIFQGIVQRCYDDGLTEARRAGEELAIRLRVDGDSLLVRFPWEVMFGPGGRSPLATSADTPLLRVVEAGGDPPPPPGLSHLRVLLAMAQPRGFPKLEMEREVEKARAALARRWLGPAISLQVLPHATAAGLRQALEHEDHQVVHFIGHGLPPTGGREAQLVLETEHGDPDLVGGQRLAGILGLGGGSDRRRELRLVVLNACHGAESEPSDGFAGVAQRLLAEGLPAAVAMRYAIADTAALLFSEVFYRWLAKGETVAKAVSRARYVLHAEVRDCSWLKPVLFQRARDAGVVLRASRWRRGLTTLGALGLFGAALLFVLLRRDPIVEPLLRPPLAANFFADDNRCPSPEGVELGFVYVEVGEFVMGSEEEGGDRPPRPVTIDRAYCLGKTEVTVAQWEAVMGDGSRSFEELRKGPGGDLPRDQVTWKEARLFAARAEERAGEGEFFLPSETQWEYAVRAGSISEYSFGEDPATLSEYGNCLGRAGRDRFDRVAPVASFEPNHWGFYDMHGNLSEWVEDSGAPHSFASPMDLGLVSKGLCRIRRGGSYVTNAGNCRSASRAGSAPGQSHATFGFRIARWPVSSLSGLRP